MRVYPAFCVTCDVLINIAVNGVLRVSDDAKCLRQGNLNLCITSRSPGSLFNLINKRWMKISGGGCPFQDGFYLSNFTNKILKNIFA